MTAHIALLRGINVGGKNQIPMAGLRILFEALGFPGARSLLNSGNIVFESFGRTGAQLECLLEAQTAKRLSARPDYLIRTCDEWKKIIAGNPFRRETEADPSRLIVMFLKQAPDRRSVRALRSAIEGPEAVHISGREVFITYPAGIGRSKLTLPMLERKLDRRGTCRNWNTVLKLSALVDERSS